MSDIQIHIGEILARNARMYPDDIALVERVSATKARTEITWKEFDEEGKQVLKHPEGEGCKER